MQNYASILVTKYRLLWELKKKIYSLPCVFAGYTMACSQWSKITSYTDDGKYRGDISVNVAKTANFKVSVAGIYIFRTQIKTSNKFVFLF